MKARNPQILQGKYSLGKERAFFIEEFYHPQGIPDSPSTVHHRDLTVKVHSWVRDAERVAFERVRRTAEKEGCCQILYTSWSAQNPDFMNGTDEKARDYDITAKLYKKVR